MAAERTVLRSWSTILGEDPILGVERPGRELWPVTATDGRQYFVKKLDPWRNLPIADEVRVLNYLRQHGVSVPEFVLTEHATIVASVNDQQFILQTRLAEHELTPQEVAASESAAGVATAQLHRALASYPWPVNSYTEDLTGTLAGELMLPKATAVLFERLREDCVARIAALPIQTVHGDFTPGNILFGAPGVISGFIDFDHLPLAPRAWDIGKYLSRRIRTGWRGQPAQPSQECLGHITSFLRGYHAESPLTGVEIAGIPAMILAGNITEISYYLEVSAGILERRKLPDHDLTTADTIAAANWHMEHWAEVEEAINETLCQTPG